MGHLASLGLVRPTFQAISPTSDYWYSAVGTQSLTGVRVSAESAMRLSAVWGCVRVISEMLSSIPLIVYERISEDERRRATGYYLYDVLSNQPNRQQTSIDFRSMLTKYALLRGNGFAEIKAGRRGFADQLIPLHPSRVTVEQFRNGAWHSDAIMEGSQMRYKVRRLDGTEETLTDDQVFHFRGMSEGGIRGMETAEYARESIGLGLATEQYGARYFGQGMSPAVAITHPGKLSREAQKRLRQQAIEDHSGLSNAHLPWVLEEGMKLERYGMTSEDAQYLELRGYQVGDIARFFGVPLHLLMLNEKSTSWGSGIEEMMLEFVIGTLLPWAVRWDQAISRDLITDTSRYYTEHLFDALVRGNLKARYDAYAVGRNWGFLSVNDIRRRENMNPVEGGDEYGQPPNSAASSMPPVEPPEPEPLPTVPQSEGARVNGHYLLLLQEAATRIIRKEMTAMSKAAKRCADDPAGWLAAIDEFYGDHAEYVARHLGMARRLADDYVLEQRMRLQISGVAAMADWETRRVSDLVARAMEVDSDE